MILVHPDGTFVQLEVRPYTLEELQHLVGGYLERVIIHRPSGIVVVVYVDEDGLSKRLPRNESFPDYVGNVLSLDGNEENIVMNDGEDDDDE